MKKLILLMCVLITSFSLVEAQRLGIPNNTTFYTNTNGNLIAHVQGGNSTDLGNFSRQWIGIGQPGNIPAYGVRTQWNGNAGILALTGTGTSKTLELNWGGPNRTGSFQINNIASFTNPNGKINRFTILANGNVGIGISAPTAKLHVDGTLKIGSFETLLDVGFGQLGLNSSLIPTDVQYGYRDLGKSSAAWRNIYFDGSLISTSDKRLKSNIQESDYGLKQILQLAPKSYDMKSQPGKKRYGLLAQDVQEVMSEFVSSTEVVVDEKGGTKKSVATEYLGVNYLDMIPVLIKAIQEQNALIEAQAARIDQLEAQSNDTDSEDNTTTPHPNSDNSRLIPQSTGKVFQNNPNPFKNNTRISYELPENTRQATLMITDMSGRQVATYTLDKQRTGEVSVNANGLPNGTYVYVLMADGQPVARNKMVVAR